jgi:hypothetical protein
MADVSGIGAIAGAAVDLAKFVIGQHTDATIQGTGKTAFSNQTDTATSAHSETDNTSTTNTDVQTSGSTINSADPGVIASLKALAQQAISNSNDPSKTTGLISGILQTAGDAMTQIFGQQKQAGIFNSASAASQNNDILSRASAQAASAVLGYQTQEQTIGSDALKSLLSATATQTTKGDTLTNSTTTSKAVSDASSTASVANFGSTAQESQQKSTSSTKMSIVCTWMFRNKLLGARRYATSVADFEKKPWYIISGYLTFSRPLVAELERDSTSFFSRQILTIFSWRTEQVCAAHGLKGCKKSVRGWLARSLVASLCFLPCLYFWSIHILGGKTVGQGVATSE